MKIKNSNINFKYYLAFTLAEVLITLGIIGVVAAIVIPAINNQTQDMEYKTAYRKAYSDISQAFAQALSEGSLTPRTAKYDPDATTSEWSVIRNALKITKECAPANLYACWANADKICTGICGGNSPAVGGNNSSFIDASGRSWSEVYYQENIYVVDTNGLRPPNRFGKDRWIFTLKDANNIRVDTGLPVKVANYTGDRNSSADGWCNYPPCYYESWLLN